MSDNINTNSTIIDGASQKTTYKKQYDLKKGVQVIRMERGCTIAKGLFTQKKELENKKCDIVDENQTEDEVFIESKEMIGNKLKYTYSNGLMLEVRFGARLGAFHLAILQGLIAIAHNAGIIKSYEDDSPDNVNFREKLKLKYNSVKGDIVIVDFNLSELATQIGKKACSTLRDDVDEALIDLGCCTFIWRNEKGKPKEYYHLLSSVKFPKGTNLYPYRVCLAPALLEVLWGRSYTMICLDEVRKIRKHNALILHTWLSSFIDPGETRKVRISKIINEVLWPDKREF